MSVKRINESFKRLYEGIIQEDAAPVYELRIELEKAMDLLAIRGEQNIKAYEIAFQDVLEKMYPDKAWWEVCSLDIFSHLFTERDPEATIEAIVDNMTVAPEVEESLVEAPEINGCPVCNRNFAESELEDSKCPKCGEVLIKTDSGEYVKYDENLTEATYSDYSGIMGEPGETYTPADLKSYWDENRGNDPVLAAYKGDYDKWVTDTLANMKRMNESVKARLESLISKLVEAEMSDEDKHDSELIHSMIQKMQARSNAAFTPEEKVVMAKYGITRNNWEKKLTVDGRELNPDLDTRSRSGYSRRTSYSNGTPSKINYADRARKLPARKQNQIAGDGSSLFVQNAYYNAHGTGRSIQDAERKIRNDRMQEPVRNMQRALKDRRYAQQQIDGADAARAKRMAAAQAAYDKAKRDAEWHYAYDTVDSARSRDYAQKQINKLLKKETNESVESSSKVFKVNYDSNGVNSAVMVRANSEDEARKIYDELKGKKYPKVNGVKEINSNDAETNTKKGMSTLN